MALPSLAAPALPAAPRRERRHGAVLSPRLSFLLRRLGRMLVAIAVVVVATFLLVHLVPGDAVRATLGPSASPELVERVRAELGLDQPLPVQFVQYVTGVFTGDLGQSLQSHRPVVEVIAQRVGPTLLLGFSAFAIAGIVSLPLGIGTALAARSARGRSASRVVTALLGLVIAIPDYLVAVALIALFSIGLGTLPAAGWGEPSMTVLPIVTLAIGPAAYLARIVHVEMGEVLETAYMTTARAKRLPARLLYLRHALPNIVSSTLTIGGMTLSGLVAATVLVETIFAIPGLGTTIVASITTKDYPMVQAVVLVFASLVLVLNLVVDLVLMTVDPRSSIAEG